MTLALVLAAAAVFSAAAVFADPVEPGAAAAAGPVATKTVTATKADYSTDPRMLAAIRRANASADAKCGQNIGNVDLATRNTAKACRRRMVENARADAEYDITPH